jgi:hypothetical protein
MTEDFEAHVHAAQVDEIAEWIIVNLDEDGVSTEMAMHSLGYAVALLVAGQPWNERELLEGVIRAIRCAFEDTLSAKAELLTERQRGGVTLQ